MARKPVPHRNTFGHPFTDVVAGLEDGPGHLDEVGMAGGGEQPQQWFDSFGCRCCG
jgi:hypothetical protein